MRWISAKNTNNILKVVCKLCVINLWDGTSASLWSWALVRRSLIMFCTACPSMDIRTRRALTRACTRTKACMHLNVTAACFLTSLPLTRAWSLTTPFNALNALLAYNHKNPTQQPNFNNTFSSNHVIIIHCHNHHHHCSSHNHL